MTAETNGGRDIGRCPARIDSTLVASRLQTLLAATQPYDTSTVIDLRQRVKDLLTTHPTTIAA
ncbi:hypothetical protein [Streptoalloteichus tenebrarius]|uniref:hypothetical protein n=1 Tax=Streptoalloteichus tenebrarius (strain ATCC 17920 / DSM 40477 / JCM 4838 / CBS 697.72 / NBRC 16177 / NCIMB 11028 / NRRL B-12390 / A12253. 1 / ISP 5477) TaxID=1933 RepID=UPI0035E8FC6B